MMRGFALACAALLARSAAAQFPPPTRSPAPTSAPTRPASVPASAAELAAGVWIDWATSEVYLSGRALRRESVLEFAASLPGKHHESLVALDAGGAEVFAALGLSGLTPGHPPLWNQETQRFTPAAGDLLEVEFAWESGGQQRRASPFDWMIELEYQRRPRIRPWVFAGSVQRPGGRLGCEVSGAAFALVDFPDSLVCLTGSRSSSNEQLWIDADVAVVPPAGTPVTVVTRPAAVHTPRIELDFRGVARVDGRVESNEEVIDVMQVARRQNPALVQDIVTDGLLDSDLERWRAYFRGAGLPDDAWRFAPRSAANWLRSALESGR